MSIKLNIYPKSLFDDVMASKCEKHSKLRTIADMCRYNAITAVKKAGSGHLGSSMSSMDIFVALYYGVLRKTDQGANPDNHHVFFSSKGHDVPGQYAVLHSVGIISDQQLMSLRRLGGLHGHPDTSNPGIEANSGSLGMGISKAKGMAWAKRYRDLSGHVFVLTGDGEFQEGQNYEALQSVPHLGLSNLTVIMDSNKVQSDKEVNAIISLRNFRDKIKQFGWMVIEIDGNEISEIENAITIAVNSHDKPVFIIANTIKGKGVAFMEHIRAIPLNNGLYPFHAGAPDDDSFIRATNELYERNQNNLIKLGIKHQLLLPIDQNDAENHIQLNALGEPVSQTAPQITKIKGKAPYIVEAYGQTLLALGEEIENLIVLDADLSADCRLRYFENKYPDRFLENGIAEQDMVSTAAGLAKFGLLPVVNSFASFLASRANEQIYNNATEGKKIIYAFHYGGLIPAGPGKSHQSIRDISLVAALPNITIIQPGSSEEAEIATRWAVKDCKTSCILRLNIGPSLSEFKMPSDYLFDPGKGTFLREGEDVLIMAYGSVMLHEATLAADLLTKNGFSTGLVNMPWLNQIDDHWLRVACHCYNYLIVLDDHSPIGGLGDQLLRKMNQLNILEDIRVHVFGIEGYPACGTPQEALAYHGMDGVSLANRIQKILE
ncbi:MAG: transketolase C-terminal domain-containing protein [Bacteroidales bacterium]|nr:transketolase C-terminal domain-containing protein [Bacteroidales bacterium]MDD3665851.1 transketolase C-terminal domain-containing protein [Bacteroidales bacterium]